MRHIAVGQKDNVITKLLLHHKADANQKGHHRATPLIVAGNG